MVELLARQLLRAHVLRRAGGDAGHRHRLRAAAIALDRFGDAKVDDLHPIAPIQMPRDHDVFWLETAVDEAEMRCCRERIGALFADWSGGHRRQWAPTSDAGVERLAIDV